MSDDKNNSGPARSHQGRREDAKGKTKEPSAPWWPPQRPGRGGQAQQDKAEAQRDAARKEAEAEAAGAAKAAEKRQESHQ